MSYKTRYEKRDGYLFARFEGQQSYEDAVRFWTDLLKGSDFRDYNRFLVIGEPIEELSLYEVQLLYTEIAKMSKGKAIAYVDPNDENFLVNSYGEKVVSKSERNARAFRNEKDALDWLLARGVKDWM